MAQRNRKTQPFFKRHAAATIWWGCAVLLIAPALLAALVRAGSYAAMCRPGPAPCLGVGLGGMLKIFLSISWAVTGSGFLLILISFIATLAVFCMRKPLAGTLSFFLMPIIALALPMLVVYVTKYDGCQINPDGVGSCVLWGTRMGMSFHTAATVQTRLYDLMPHLAGITVMLGLLGWFFARPGKRRVKPQDKMAMHMRDFTQPPPEQN